MGLYKLTSRAIIGAFFERLEQNPGAKWIDKIAASFSSNMGEEEYAWLGQSPMMREWVGGRHAKGLSEHSYKIPNIDFEATLEVAVADLRRDKSPQVLQRIRDLADRTNAHWAKLLSAKIIAGEASLCYDGHPFFDTDHSEGDSGSQSNLLSIDIATTTAPTASEMEKSVLSGISKILSFKDNEGEPLNENAQEFVVMVPVPFLEAAGAALKSPVIVDALGARTNTIIAYEGFLLNLVVNPRLTWTTKFGIFRADGNGKPLIKQEETPVEIDALAEGSELEFKHNKHQYGVKTSRNVGYGFWQHGCMVSFT